MKENIKKFIEFFVIEIEEENKAIFSGAGFFVTAVYFEWKKSNL